MKNYIKDVKETEIKDYTPSQMRCNDKIIVRLLHGVIGISTEAGELLDAFKKYIYYNKELDYVNIKEELGDILWYIAIVCDELDLSFEEIAKVNIKKLKQRYDAEFSDHKAKVRDLERERILLEGKDE